MDSTPHLYSSTNSSNTTTNSSSSNSNTTAARPQPVAAETPHFYVALMNATNMYRARHHADALHWSAELAADAARWAEACTFKPDPQVNGGENIYATSSVAGLSGAMDNAVKLW